MSNYNGPKDALINFKSTNLGKNSKGGDRFQFSLSQEQATELCNAIGALLENPRGVKLDIHVGEKQTNDGQRSFLSSFTYVKAIQDPSQQGQQSSAPKRFVPVNTASIVQPTNITTASPGYTKKF